MARRMSAPTLTTTPRQNAQADAAEDMRNLSLHKAKTEGDLSAESNRAEKIEKMFSTHTFTQTFLNFNKFLIAKIFCSKHFLSFSILLLLFCSRVKLRQCDRENAYAWIHKPHEDLTYIERKAHQIFGALEEYLSQRASRVYDYFRTLDTDNSKNISKQELLQGLQTLRVKPLPSIEDVGFVINLADEDGDGELCFSELDKIIKMFSNLRRSKMSQVSSRVLDKIDEKIANEFMHHSSNDPSSLQLIKSDDTITLFGWLAFTESLIRMAIHFCNKKGNHLQQNSSTLARVYWLYVYLHNEYKLKMHEHDRDDASSISSNSTASHLFYEHPIERLFNEGGNLFRRQPDASCPEYNFYEMVHCTMIVTNIGHFLIQAT